MRPILLGRRSAAKLARERSLLLGAEDIEAELDTADAFELANMLIDLRVEAVLQGTARNGQRDRDRDVAVIDLDAPDHAELDNGAAELWIVDPLERAHHIVATRHRISLPGSCSATHRERSGAASGRGARTYPHERPQRRVSGS